MTLQSEAIYVHKKKDSNNIYIFRSRCKWWTSGWHWEENCLKNVQNIITLHEIDESSKINHYDLKLWWIQGIWIRNSSSKYLRSWNLRSKLHLISCFYASLLMIGFEDLILIFRIWVPNLKIEVIRKNNQF